ncbi:type II toxin-antitoxin system RelE/ParE family toxin [bacterium]|nr:MAG: type II toxin-antitoxin system RelE/ParE family toxin [bacterium]
MIKTFADTATSDLFHGILSTKSRKIPSTVQTSAIVKLDMINAAIDLIDLKSPPGNRLEALKGDLQGFYSIRVNSQWRIIFKWENGNAFNVQIIDYH